MHALIKKDHNRQLVSSREGRSCPLEQWPGSRGAGPQKHLDFTNQRVYRARQSDIYGELAQACEFSREEMDAWSDQEDKASSSRRSDSSDSEYFDHLDCLFDTQIVWRAPQTEAWVGITFPEVLMVCLPVLEAKSGEFSRFVMLFEPSRNMTFSDHVCGYKPRKRLSRSTNNHRVVYRPKKKKKQPKHQSYMIDEIISEASLEESLGAGINQV